MTGNRILFLLNKFIVLLTLFFLVILFSYLSPYFLSFKNFTAIGMTISVIGIVCIGQTLCILIRGFDLSVGATTALAGMIVASLVNSGFPYLISIVITLIACGFVGWANGFLITYGKINPLITTLAMMSVVTGAVFIISDGYAIFAKNTSFTVLGTNKLAGIPYPILILLFLYGLFYVLLNHSVFGRYLYCIGGNPEAARIAGINVRRMTVLVYTLSGALSGFAGIILASRLGAGQTSAGSSYALDSIAAVVLGGTSLVGGIGNILGSLFGVIIIGTLQNGLVMLDIKPYYQNVATGAVLLLAVYLQSSTMKKRK
jgi:ribose/xylose/arabinose/galactoside ABC-type transport system permease subunit